MKKLILLMALISIFLIGVVGAVTDAPVMSVPATGGVVGEDGLINVSFASNLDGNDTAACAVFIMSASTANSSWSLLINITNSSNDDNDQEAMWGDLNATLGVEFVVEPSNNYQVYPECYNSTSQGDAGGSRVGSTVTGVIFDRGDVPPAPTTSHTAQTIFANGDTITYTVDGANTTGCKIAFLANGQPPRATGSNVFAMTHSGDSCTYSVAIGAPSDGIYNVYVQASDGTNTSFSSRLDFNIEAFGEQSRDTVDVSQVGVEVVKKDNKLTTIFWIFAAVGAFLFFFTDVFKKKK